MAQCMNALADKVHHKQEVSCRHAHSHMLSITLFNNHPYINSSSTSVGTKFIATYVGMHGYWIMLWSAYHYVHGTSFLVYVLCQPVHSCIEPFLHQLDFSVFRNLFMETFLTEVTEVSIILLSTFTQRIDFFRNEKDEGMLWCSLLVHI